MMIKSRRVEELIEFQSIIVSQKIIHTRTQEETIGWLTFVNIAICHVVGVSFDLDPTLNQCACA